MNKEKMILLRLQGKSYAEIGRKFGVSKQRILQIIGPPPEIKQFIYNKYNGICQVCNTSVKKKKGHVHHQNGNNTLVENYNEIDNLILVCIGCHRTLHTIPELKKTKYCPTCGKSFKIYKHVNKKYCSCSCFHKSCWSTLICNTCGKAFKRRNTYVRRAKKDPAYKHHGELVFCSRNCFFKRQRRKSLTLPFK